MHFSTSFPSEAGGSGASAATATAGTATAAAAASEKAEPNSSSSIAGAQGGAPPSSLANFSHWHVLIRMNVENEVCFVKGEAKVFSPTASLASPSARGIKRNGESVVHVTAPDGIPIVPIHQKDRKCHVLIEGTYRVQDGMDSGASTFRLEVHFERLEAEVLGLRDQGELRDVVFSCPGHKACGWHMGTVSVTVGGKELALPTTLRFLLKPYYGKRCTNCLDPVYAIGYTCDECEVTHYCSRECLNAHMKRGHGLLCPLLKDKYRFKSGSVATEVSDDTGLVAWWRCLDNAYYSILVDSGNALGAAVEFTLCTLKSAKDEGLQYRFITPKSSDGEKGKPSASPPVPTPEEVTDFSCVLLREVNRSAILEGCVSLASACLNHLYVFSPSSEITIQAHVLFFTAFHCDEFEGPITTVEEYVSYARPLHALASLQIEYALKSPIAAEFWRRIKIAKEVIIALFTVNASGPCADVEEMKEVIANQQCETLTMLSRVFVMMAARTPQNESGRWLEQAEKCLRQCSDSDSVKKDDYTHGVFCFRLSALLLLYRDDAKTEEANQLRQRGETLIRASRAAQTQQSGAEAAEQQATGAAVAAK